MTDPQHLQHLSFPVSQYGYPLTDREAVSTNPKYRKIYEYWDSVIRAKREAGTLRRVGNAEVKIVYLFSAKKNGSDFKESEFLLHILRGTIFENTERAETEFYHTAGPESVEVWVEEV